MVAPPSVDDAGVREDSRSAVAGRRNGAGAAPAGRRISVKTQRDLSDDQERLRIEGLRALARIIARRALAQSRRPADSTPGMRTDGTRPRARIRREHSA